VFGAVTAVAFGGEDQPRDRKPQTSGRSIGGLSSVAPPARNSCAGRPP
jgi:hypothetical protein